LARSHEDTETPLAENDRLSVFVLFSENILFTIKVDVNRKKNQPKVSPGLGKNGVKLLLTCNFGSKLASWETLHGKGRD
jgi:hypothetical protein